MSYNYKVKPVSAEELENLVRAAKAERDRQVREAVVRGAKAVAKFFHTVSDAVTEAYEAERKRTASEARNAMQQRWASGD